ncbi:Protein RALF-like 24 [Acorus calamus]|uniref:Protein RALF-like 24 n=1 Tax=Acorus calamus TaxID=4465 RepID=A0AAV9D195_ACOCL|nr:Protein RALF-like 24 [Acorus calamus]
MAKPSLKRISLTLLLFFHTHLMFCVSDPNVSVTKAADEPKTGFLVEASEEVEMDSEINRRVLVGQKRYISYESLKGDAVPCMRPGVSYYECHDLNKANSLTRGCSIITRCARDVGRP